MAGQITKAHKQAGTGNKSDVGWQSEQKLSTSRRGGTKIKYVNHGRLLRVSFWLNVRGVKIYVPR
jgi:hypothetical protein